MILFVFLELFSIFYLFILLTCQFTSTDLSSRNFFAFSIFPVEHACHKFADYWINYIRYYEFELADKSLPFYFL